VCDTTPGSCSYDQCNQCCTEFPDGSAQCFYSGCPGYSCPQSPSAPLSNVTPELEHRAHVAGPEHGASRLGGAPVQLSASNCEGCASRPIDFGPETLGVTGELLIPPDVPLDYSALRLHLRSNGAVSAGSYTLKNSSRLGLVTVVTRWQFRGENPGSAPATSTQVIDSWQSDRAFLAPAAQQVENFSLFVRTPQGERVQGVVATVVYAEFEDGTRVGPEATTMGANLRSQRQRILAAYHDLLERIRAGVPDRDLEEYIQTTHGIKWLTLVREKEGWAGVVAEISKPRHLKP
jgi:hypothetical protein